MIDQTQKKPAKKPSHALSVASYLFSPRLGASVRPLQTQFRGFAQLIAAIFSLYGLFPKDHPFLKNADEAPMSLLSVIATAYSRLTFKRETLPQTIMFFAIVAIMLFSAGGLVIAMASLFISPAHASSAFFVPASNDLAVGWLNYLFRGGSYYSTVFSGDDFVAYLDDPFSGSVSLQNAFAAALAFYSNAILLVAGIILFYHLVSMVAETAHYGEVMGKKANKIWAPIRLVFAIGLLVPINGGLNTGQYIVVKAAELGSGMASQTWNIFLNYLSSFQLTFVAPRPNVLAQVALDLIRMKGCQKAWDKLASSSAVGVAKMTTSSSSYYLGNMQGQRTSFSSDSLSGKDLCGSYFVPGTGSSNAFVSQAASMQQTAIDNFLGNQASKIADEIVNVLPLGDSTAISQQGAPIKNDVIDAMSDYQQSVNTQMAALALTQAAQISSVIAMIKPYGWAMAGSFLNTIERIQATLTLAAVDSTPKTYPPNLHRGDKERPEGQGDQAAGAWNIYKQVAGAMSTIDNYVARSIDKGNSSSARCAAAAGLKTDASEGESGVASTLFHELDQKAQQFEVWTAGNGSASCGGSSNGSPFQIGIRIGGHDPLSQISALGQKLLSVAFGMYEVSVGSGAASGIFGAFSGVFGAVGGGLTGGISSLAAFGGSIFVMMGFALAYLVPLMPFMHFFFAVLSWVVAVIEAVVAVPLIALAQLTPEGDGLPGQAKKAFYFIFDIFLRPTLTIFGLIAGLIMLYIGLSFLNFAYAVAVSGAASTAFGFATMNKVIYTILYVIIVYSMANHCFMLVDHFPAHALQWMGQGGLPVAKMGSAEKIEGLSMIMSTNLRDPMKALSKNAGDMLGKGAGGALKGLGAAGARGGGGMGRAAALGVGLGGAGAAGAYFLASSGAAPAAAGAASGSAGGAAAPAASSAGTGNNQEASAQRLGAPSSDPSAAANTEGMRRDVASAREQGDRTESRVNDLDARTSGRTPGGGGNPSGNA